MIPEQARIAVLVAVGLLNLFPAIAFFAPSALRRLYGAGGGGGTDGAMLLMLRHRAALLGIVGGGLLASAFFPEIRTPAIVAGFVSMGSYVWLWIIAAPEVKTPLQRVAILDLVALPVLALAAL